MTYFLPIKTLFALGDCNTFPDHLLPHNDHLVSWVKNHLIKMKNHPVEAINIAQGMYTTREGLKRLKDTPLNPDYVMINFGLVDAWVTSFPKLYIGYYPENIWRKLPLKWLKIIKKKLRHLKGIIPRGHVVPIEEYEQNIRMMIKICRMRNEGVKILLWSTVYTGDKTQRNTEIQRYNGVLKKISQSENCIYLDTNQIIDYQNKEYFLDIVHLSAKATEILGRVIAEKF